MREWQEIQRITIEDEVVIILRDDDGNYAADIEGYDGLIEFAHQPTSKELETLIRDRDEAERLAAEDAALQAEVAAIIEARNAEEADIKALLAESARLDELHPLSHFEATGLAKADTLRRAAIEGRLEAEKIGRDWFTTERDVRRFLARRNRKEGNMIILENQIRDLAEQAGLQREWRTGAGRGWHVLLKSRRGGWLRYGVLDQRAGEDEREEFGEDAPGGAYIMDEGDTAWFRDIETMLQTVRDILQQWAADADTDNE